jgi:hypothetical protein
MIRLMTVRKRGAATILEAHHHGGPALLCSFSFHGVLAISGRGFSLIGIPTQACIAMAARSIAQDNSTSTRNLTCKHTNRGLYNTVAAAIHLNKHKNLTGISSRLCAHAVCCLALFTFSSALLSAFDLTPAFTLICFAVANCPIWPL